ncbi:MAG TPA: AEC family transporter [Polyangiales bacterium]|nr:AEC family transporter [Polyangiales bacterium]
MSLLWQYFQLSLPLFATILLGYVIALLPFWQARYTQWASRVVFGVLLPALLFHKLSDLSSLPPVDARLLLAYFGSCFLVFGLGRLVGARGFALDGVSQSVFALGGIFSNNVLLGLPLARATLGTAALPSVALVVVFNSLTLWTLVSVSIEWARHGALSVRGFGRTALGVLTNPIVASILIGTAFGMSGWTLPQPIERAVHGLSIVAAPAALVVLGGGLAQHGMRRDLPLSLTICMLKLVVQPLMVWLLSRIIGLPPLESKVVVLLASLSTGANVYLMATQFETLEAAIASSLVLSTALAAMTVPVLLWTLG